MNERTRKRNLPEFKQFLSRLSELRVELTSILIKENPPLIKHDIENFLNALIEHEMLLQFIRAVSTTERLLSVTELDFENSQAFDEYKEELLAVYRQLHAAATSVTEFASELKKASHPMTFLTLYLWQDRHDLTRFKEVLEQVKLSKKILVKIRHFLSEWEWEPREYHQADTNNNHIITPSIFGTILSQNVSNHKKSTGTYYTPRFICDFMSKISIRLWILSKISDSLDTHKSPSIKTIDDVTVNWKEFFQKSGTLLLKKYRELVKKPLILDNSCGSGEFLVSMLEQMTRVQASFFQLVRQTDISIDSIKASIIKFQLHGSDINHRAVATTRLRLWLNYLSETNHQVDFSVFYSLILNIRAGNSLIGIKDKKMMFLRESDKNLQHDLSTLSKLREKILASSSRSPLSNLSDFLELKHAEDRCHAQCNKIYSLMVWRSKDSSMDKAMLKDIHPLHWPVLFPHVFLSRQGFDVVIGNPPYVRQEQITTLKPHLKRHYQVYDSIADLYVYFFEQAHGLLARNGILTYIVSNKWLRARYGQTLREFLAKKFLLYLLLDMNGHQIFRDANIETCIVSMQKLDSSDIGTKQEFIHAQFIQQPKTEKDLINQIRDLGRPLRQKNLGKEWLLFPQEIINLRKKIERKGKPLKNYSFMIYRGIVTGFNEAFIIDKETYLQLVEEKTTHLLRPLIRGKDITRRWQVTHQGEYLIYSTKKTIPNLDQYPKIKRHFLKYRSKLLKMSHVKSELRSVINNKHLLTRIDNMKNLSADDEEFLSQSCHWWILQDPKRLELFLQPKIMYPDIAVRPLAVFDEQGLVFNNTVYFITHANRNELLFLLGFLNSKVFEFYFKTVASKIGKRGYRFFTQFIEKTPLVIPPNLDSCIELTYIQQLIRTPKSDSKDITDWEKRLDEWYYSIYEITKEEKEIIEQFINQDS